MTARQLATGLAWPEGPAVLPDGSVAFVETYASHLGCWSPTDGHRVLADTGGGPNAVQLGSDGYLYCCQNGGVVGPWRAEEIRPPSIQRVSLDGKVEIVATEVDGYALRAPNDLAFGADGRLYFTDPGGSYDPENRPDPGRIFALAKDGTGELVAELPHVYPNGIVVEADGALVWVESYTRTVRRRAVDGTVTEVAVLDEGHVPDGLAVAGDGALYVTTVTSGGIDVLGPDGTPREFLPIGAVPTNCCFDGTTLYVTDGGRPGETADAGHGGVLWALDAPTPGLPLFT